MNVSGSCSSNRRAVPKLRTTGTGSFAGVLPGHRGDGQETDQQRRTELIGQASRGELPLPEIQLADSESLNGAFGAYSSERSGMIFINKSLTLSPDCLLAVLMEEVGHHLDHALGGPDTAGDEGRMFLTAVAKGAPLAADEMDLARDGSDEATLTLNGRQLTLELALPVAAVWLAKAAGATAVDAFLEYGLAAITGTPPGVLTHVGNFAMNLVPGVGEARKAKKLGRLLKAIDVASDTVWAVSRFPGGDQLLKSMAKARTGLSDAITSGNLVNAKGALNNIVGAIREAQVALRLRKYGSEILQLGKKIPNADGKELTEIDVIAREWSQVFYSQVKSAGALMIGRGSDRWKRFIAQADRTLSFAQANGGRVRYYVDEISDDALQYLRGKGIDVIKNANFLR